MITGAIPLEAEIPLATVAGLFVGSFLNVVVYRTPLGLSVASRPARFCPSCKRQLQWWENIPRRPGSSCVVVVEPAANRFLPATR